MKKDFLDTITVKSPCGESWDEMTGSDEVRFCSHCAKDVHNITAMNRAEAEKLVKRSNGKICVRIEKNPTAKLVTASPKPIQIKRSNAFAAGILATSLTLSTITYAQSEPIIPKSNSNQTQKDNPSKSEDNQTFSSVSGEIKDASGAVITNVKITLRDTQTGKIRVTQSDENGFYEFRNVEAGIYEIEAESNGFIKLVLKDVEILENTKLTKELVLEVGALMGDVVIIDESEIKPNYERVYGS